MRLVDYKVRILTPQAGTKAVTRVMIESADGPASAGRTVGVSGQHHRRLLQRAARRDHLEAAPRPRGQLTGTSDERAPRRRSWSAPQLRREYRHGGARHAELRPDRSAPGARRATAGRTRRAIAPPSARRRGRARRRACSTPLAEAIADLTLVYATTARDREMVKPMRHRARGRRGESARARGGGERSGSLFGPERTGLENDDVSLADSADHACRSTPTSPRSISPRRCC